MILTAILHGLLGTAVLTAVAVLFSSDRRSIRWRTVISGYALLLLFAVLVLRGRALAGYFGPLGWPQRGLEGLSAAFVKLLGFTAEGAKFVFGNLAATPGTDGSLGFFFAFQVLPTIIFFASLMSVLYHLGIMERVVCAMAWLMARAMGTSGAESLSGAANVFVGQTEAPLFIKPYLPGLTRSELLAVMVGGMCTTAGGVLAAYVQILGQAYAETRGMGLEAARTLFASHLLGASLMAAPAGLAIAKILLPETEDSQTGAGMRIALEREATGLIEAAAAGAADGLKLALNVAATLLAFVCLIALVNSLLGTAGDWLGLNDWLRERFGAPLSLQLALGVALRFLGGAIGVPAADALHFGSLIGTKLVLNEFIAYLDFSAMMRNGVLSSDKTILMASFALCGFANLASIAVQIGGIGPLVPDRRKDIAALGLKAVLGGTLANLLTATIAGMFVGA